MSFTAESIAALDAGETEFYFLVEFDFATPIRCSFAPYDIEHDGNTWLSDAIVSELPKSFSESLAIRSTNLTITMAGAALSNQVLPLTEQFLHRDVNIYFYVAATGQAVLFWQGQVDTWVTEENVQGGVSTIKWTVKSHQTLFDSTRGRVLSDAEQQRLFPGDTGFKYVGKIDAALSNWNSDDAEGATGWAMLDGLLDAGSTLVDSAADAVSSFVSNIGGLFGGGGGGGGGPKGIRVDKISDFKTNLVKMPSAHRRLQVAYGTARLKPIKFFRSVDPDDESVLYVGFLLCEGEIDSIVDIQFDKGESYTSDKYSSNVTLLDSTLGTATQAASASLIAKFSTEWLVTDQLKGCATAVLKFTKGDAFSGEPNPLFVVKGRKCYDPRVALTQWSANPALIARDYITDTLFGRGLDASLIADDTVSAAADLAETQVADHDGSGTGPKSTTPVNINLLEFNGVLSTDNTVKANLQKILFCLRGHMPWVRGQYEFVVEQTGETAVATFSEADMTGVVKISEKSSGDKYNAIYYELIDPEFDYLKNIMVQHSAAYLALDNGQQNYKVVSNAFENNRYRGLNRAGTVLKKSRSAYLMNFTAANASAVDRKPGEVIGINRTSQGWAGKLFRIVEKKTTNEAVVSFDLEEYTSTDWDWDVSVEDVPPPDTLLPENIYERTGWLSRYSLDSIFYENSFDSISGLIQTGDIIQTTATGQVWVRGDVGTTTDGKLTRYLSAVGVVASWDKRRRFKVRIGAINMDSGSSPYVSYFGMGDPNGTNFVGISMKSVSSPGNYVEWYGFVKNASGSTETTFFSQDAGGNRDIEVTMTADKVVFKQGGAIRTVTTNIPTGSTDANKILNAFVNYERDPATIALMDYKFLQDSI